MVDILNLIELILTIIGTLVTLLTIIAPITPAKWDDKVLLVLKGVWNSVKVNKEDQTILIGIKKK
jgi:hypothetical protein